MTITFTIANESQYCDPQSVNGMLSFRISAVDDATGASKEMDWSVACEMDAPGELYASSVLSDKCKAIADKAGLYDELTRRLGVSVDSFTPVVITDAEKVAQWVVHIDNLVFSVSNRVTRFQPAYLLRESEARAYIASEYTAPITSLITRFADNNKMSYPDAANLVVRQADNLRSALLQLEDLRMDKYLVLHAQSIEEAEEQYQQIINGVNAISETLK